MKHLFIISLVLLVFGCNVKEQTAAVVLNNVKLQKEVFEAIVADSSLSAEMIDLMMVNKKTQSIMLNHSGMSRLMCNSERLDSLTKADQEMNNIMLNWVHCRIDRDSSWCRKLSTIIHEKDNTRTEDKKKIP